VLALGRSVAAVDARTPGHPPMARRSWYLPQADADRLALLVNDLHFTTRRPRHEVLAAVVAVIVGHRAEIEARLTSQGSAA
jgi:hypothetical protein